MQVNNANHTGRSKHAEGSLEQQLEYHICAKNQGVRWQFLLVYLLLIIIKMKQLVDSVPSLLSAHYEAILIGQSLLFWVKYSSDGEDEGGKHT